MISSNEAALICDFAEVYHIYDYRSLPLMTAATFFVGLRHDSRCKMSLSGQEYTLTEMISVMIYDKLAWLQWAKTKDGSRGRNRPEPFALKLFGKKKSEDSEIRGFESPEDFEAERKRILKGGITNG